MDKNALILMAQPFEIKSPAGSAAFSLSHQIYLVVQRSGADNTQPHSAQDHSVYLLDSSGHTVELSTCVFMDR